MKGAGRHSLSDALQDLEIEVQYMGKRLADMPKGGCVTLTF